MLLTTVLRAPASFGRSLFLFFFAHLPPPGNQNNLHELWALLNFLLPSVFKDSEAFSKVFDLNVDDADKKQNMIKQLHKILRWVVGHRAEGFFRRRSRSRADGVGR